MAWRKGSFYLPRKPCVTSLAKKNVSIHGRCKSKTSFVGIKFEAENWCATVNNCRFWTKEDPNVDWQIFHSFKHQCIEYFWSTNCNCFSVKLAFLFWKMEKKTFEIEMAFAFNLTIWTRTKFVTTVSNGSILWGSLWRYALRFLFILFKFKLRFNAYQREKTRQTKQNKTENEIEKALKLPPDLKQHACICRKDKSESKKNPPPLS